MKIRTCEGVYRGVLLRQPQGHNGFGYDPIFYDPRVGKAVAEMTVAEKNTRSHRGQALQDARALLQEEFCNLADFELQTQANSCNL